MEYLKEKLKGIEDYINPEELDVKKTMRSIGKGDVFPYDVEDVIYDGLYDFCNDKGVDADEILDEYSIEDIFYAIFDIFEASVSKIKDSETSTSDEIDLKYIGNLLKEGYYSGYEPQWYINATIDGVSLEDYGLSFRDIDLIYNSISYCVEDGYDNYWGLEVELDDGEIVYVDFEIVY